MRAEALARDGNQTMERLGDVWALNGAAFIVAIALARQGRTDEATVLAERCEERYAWMGKTDAVCRGLVDSERNTWTAGRGARIRPRDRRGCALHRLQSLPVARTGAPRTHSA